MTPDSSIGARLLNDQTLLLTPGSSLDISNAHEMVAAITSAQARGYRFVVIDMQAVTLLASTGVGAILGTIETFRADGGDIIICHLADNIRHVLEVLDLIDYLTITNTREEASARCHD